MRLKIGKRIDAYHDGKMSPSRLEVVEVVAVSKIADLGKKHLRMWKKAIVEDFDESLMGRLVCYAEGPQRFWDWNCGEFVFAKFVGDKETERDPIMFAKRAWGGWYGVNWNYMLDLGGKVRKEWLKQWEACAKENGRRFQWNEKELKYEWLDEKTGVKAEA